MKQAKKKITSDEFDKKFDNGESVIEHLDVRKAKMHKRVQRINIDFPTKFLKEIDKEAEKIGVARTALIKIWIAERLEKVAHI